MTAGRSSSRGSGWSAGSRTSRPGTASRAYAVAAGALHAHGRRRRDAPSAAAALRRRRTTARPTPARSPRRSPAPAAWGVLLVRKGGFAVARLAGHGLVGAPRSGSGTCRAAPRPAARASSGSPGGATTRPGRPTRRPPSTPHRHPRPGRLDRAGLRRGPAGRRAGARRPAAAPAGRLRVEPWLAVPDPRRAVLDQAVLDAGYGGGDGDRTGPERAYSSAARASTWPGTPMDGSWAGSPSRWRSGSWRWPVSATRTGSWTWAAGRVR